MKSIKQQYINLTEGKMSQGNFMRSLRMTMPHYITNVTSFGDAVKILKNKGVITEAPGFKSKPEETPKVQDGSSIELDGMLRDLYGKPFLGGYFLDYTKVPHELVLQISKAPAQDGQKTSDIEKLGTAVLFKDSEWSFNNVRVGANEQETLDKIAALAYPTANATSENKDPNEDAEFDAMLKQLEDEMAGEIAVKSDVLDEPLEEITEAQKQEKAKTQPDENVQEVLTGIEMEHLFYPQESYETIRNMVYKNIKKNPRYYTNIKLTGIRDFEMQTMDSSKPEDHQMKFYTEKTAVDTARGMKKVKMPKVEEKKKIKENVDEKMRFQDLPADPEKYKIVKDSKGYIIKATNADGVEFQKGDTAKTYDGEEIKIAKFEESQGKVKAIYNKGMFFAGIDIDGLEAGKPEFRPGVDMGGSMEKLKNMVREMMKEMFDGRDNLTNISDDTK